MESFRVRLIFPEAKISDLGKLPSAINIPGGSTLVNVLEKYYKKFTGGLPVDMKMTITNSSLNFTQTFGQD